VLPHVRPDEADCWKIDLEVSFANGETVMEYIEVLIRSLWSTFLQVHLPSTFRRVSYIEAMALYGSDKPDTRIGMEV
jgi:aspartyl-tRNA synthetase